MTRNETIKFAMDCFVVPPLARLLAMTNEDCDTPLAPLYRWDTKVPLLAITCRGFLKNHAVNSVDSSSVWNILIV